MAATAPTGRAPALVRSVFAGYRRLPLKAKVGTAILFFFILVAILGPALAPYSPNATTTQSLPKPPNLHHLFGTDATGGDVLSESLPGRDRRWWWAC